MKPLLDLVETVSNLSKAANLKSKKLLNEAYEEHRNLNLKSPEQIRKELESWNIKKQK